jgi:hypothetical protein
VEYLTVTLDEIGIVLSVGGEDPTRTETITEFCKATGYTILTGTYVALRWRWECILQRPVEALTPMQKFLDRYPVYVMDEPTEADRG